MAYTPQARRKRNAEIAKAMLEAPVKKMRRRARRVPDGVKLHQGRVKTPTGSTPTRGGNYRVPSGVDPRPNRTRTD